MAGTALARFAVRLDTLSARAMRRFIAAAPLPPGYAISRLGSVAIRWREHRGEGTRSIVFAADPPVVLEHYDTLVSELGQSPGVGRVVVLELPGFGFSPAGRDFAFTNDAMVRCLEAFFEEHALSSVTLCFPCASAYAALGLAAARPELVTDLVLCQAPDFEAELAWMRGRDPTGILNRPAIGQLAMRALRKSRAPGWFALSLGDETRARAMTALADEYIARGAMWSLASAFQRFLSEGSAPPAVDQPILSLWGKRDGSHAATDPKSSLRLGRDVRLVEWSDVGHFPELEVPKRFVSLLASFGAGAP